MSDLRNVNLECSVVSCVLQPPNQTRVNANFSLPAGAAEERADAEGRGAVRPPRGGRHPTGPRPGRELRLRVALPKGRSVPGVPRGPRPSRRPAGGAGTAPPGGRGPAALPQPLASPPCLAPQPEAARPPVPAGRRRSGSLRPGLLLSFGALVCFLTCCNAASIFPPALSKTAVEIPHLGGNRMCTPPGPAQLLDSKNVTAPLKRRQLVLCYLERMKKTM